MIAISLGWGVQSFTLAAMSALGDLPPVDVAIHADTTHERADTYAFALRWTPWLEEHRMKVTTVSPPEAPVIDQYHGVMIPAKTELNDGIIRRQCTDGWKRAPMRRWLQANRHGEPVELWIGISLDEFQRMKPSDVKYITHKWPLIDKQMTRADCVIWLQSRDLEVPPKSACPFCPYRPMKDWREIQKNPSDWNEAVRVDRLIRDSRPGYKLFVHRSRKPLEDVDLRSDVDRGQLSLWDDECSGLCGV
jgi:3'-phosphoadenosine 5'-phosphosulfate sulfotransferase (PAPS reductase)/FAD synthetase